MDASLASFCYGNPRVRVSSGTLQATDMSSRILCMLDIPSHVSISELSTFVSPFLEDMAIMQVVRGGTTEQDYTRDLYSVLMLFHEEERADEFTEMYSGRVYNSSEIALCRVNAICPSPSIVSLLSVRPEDPCSVCLDSLEDSGAVISILCLHQFHVRCLRNWSDISCPVCRYSMTPEEVSLCLKCSAASDLWRCLLCGHVGCGRYSRAHAKAHYEETGHKYSLDIETQMAWDYDGDDYVHRLLDVKSDGKLGEDAVANRKLEHMYTEFNYMLSSQLHQQRQYFEAMLREDVEYWTMETTPIEKELLEIEKAITQASDELQISNELVEEKKAELKKASALALEATNTNKTLTALNDRLIESQGGHSRALEIHRKVCEARCQKQIEKKREEVRLLQEELQDLDMFLATRKKLGRVCDDVFKGEFIVSVGEPAPKPGKKSKKKRRK